jgi:hypothetical protein
MVDGVFEAKRNFLDDFSLVVVTSASGATIEKKYKVLYFRMKI